MTDSRASARHGIAVVGMSGRFPGARTLDQFWQNLRDGVESLDSFTDAELSEAGIDASTRARPGWVARGTVLEDADLFDASFFGYSPREAQVMDPQQRVFLECAYEALEHAGYAGEPDGMAVGVYAGASMNSYVLSQLLADRELVASVGGYQLMLGNDKDFLCTRVSYKLDLHGPSMTIQTACSTSLVAVQVACRALQRGECDMALAGGVSVNFPQRTGYQYQEGMIFSPDGTCRPFDAEARGTRAGAGAGVVVLKRLEDAIADRDTIHAVILGAAINNDGAGKAGYTAPSVDGQVEVIATAHALAGIEPRSISYVEAHGTATPLGDPIEVAALTRAFRASTDDVGFCTLGSLKANIGHLDAAAGVAGLIKTVLALRNREIPPLVHFRTPNPQLALPSSPFRVATASEPWPAAEMPRRAGVSSFGIGGTNAHVVLEQAPTPTPSVSHRAHQLLVLSARTPEALDAATARLVEHLRAHPEVALADVAYTTQVGRRAFPHRRAVVTRDVAEAAESLAHPERPPVLAGLHSGAARPVGFLFSGQGSQHAGMGAELFRDEPVFRAVVDRCAELLLPHLGRDLRDLLREGTDAELSETRFAQPLLFTTELALATLWKAWGVEPAAMLGHSVGEYVAAHLAGVLSLEDALELVAARGRLMQALPSGAMMAVSLPAEALRARLRPGVEIAAVNAPSLCTVSGTHEAIAALAAELSTADVEHRALHTSHAFHSAMMEPALEPFREIVGRVTLSTPRHRYVSNVTGTWITAEQATSPDYYVEHLRRAVRFAEGVETMAGDPSLLLLEVGPGNALSSLARMTLGREGSARVVSSQPHPRDARGQVDAMLTAAGRLWTAGAALSWEGMHRDERLQRVPLPTYPFERKRYWVDAPQPAASEASPGAYRRTTLDDWFHLPTWAHAPVALTRRGTIEGTWLVMGGTDSLTEPKAAGLRARGASVVVVHEGESFARRGEDGYDVRPAAAEDYTAVIRDLRARGRGLRVSGVVHLWNVGEPEKGGADDATRPLHALMALGSALLGTTSSAAVRLVVATTGAQSVLGEAVTAPTRSLVAGPALVLPAEQTSLRVTAIDLAEPQGDGWAELAAEALLTEAAADDGETFVAWRAGLRWARRFAETPMPAVAPEAIPLRDGGVYLVTGGLGGIGVTLAEWLAGRVSARLLLTSRRPLPDRDAWDAWLTEHGEEDAVSSAITSVRRIEAAGGEVLVVQADVADYEAMRRAVDAARERWGAVDGVIHSAGVAGGSLVAFSSVSETDDVLRAKVEGTAVLARIFESTPLDFVALFSSINAAVGAPGTCAYSAACAYLDAFAISSRRPASWRRTISIAWDAWRDVGMATRVEVAAALQAARRAYVDAGIPPRDGAEAFGRSLAAGLPQLLVSPYEVERILGARRRAACALTGPAEQSVAAPATPETSAPRMTSTPSPAMLDGIVASDTPEGDVEARLTAIWEDLLGVSPVGTDDNFFELGGHSLLATRVLARIDDSFGVRLPLRAVFEAPSVRQLAATIVAHGAADLATASSGDREEFEL